MTDEAVSIETAMGQNVPLSYLLDNALIGTGFAICNFPPDDDECEKCGKNFIQLHWRSCDYFSQDGEYFCADCVIAEDEANRIYERDLSARAYKRKHEQN